MRPAMRLAAITEIPTIYVLTHDSIGLGEDGPTHQPVEQLASLRAMPHMMVMRPGDANEVVEAWKTIMPLKHNPVALVLTRQALPTIDRSKYAPASGVAKGGYVLADAPGGMPSTDIFDMQDETYKKSVLPPEIKARVSVEAGSVFGWERYVGTDGAIIGMTTFGGSAPIKDLMKKFGFTTEHVIQAAKDVLAHTK